MRRGKIVVVGSLNLDLVAHLKRMPTEGETLMGTDFATYSGGKGANQAVAAAKLGGDVAMIGNLGRDLFAEELRRELDAAGVDSTCVQNVDGPSGTAVILVNAQGANSIVVIAGANGLLKPERMDECGEMLAGAAVILAQLETPLETVKRLGVLANEAGVPFVLDPAPAQRLPADLLRTVTWLTPNETETKLLLEHMGQEGCDLAADGGVEHAAQSLLAAGPRNVILKLGERGVYLAGADVESTFVEPFAVQAVDTTAAGDAFNGGFAFGLAKGYPAAEAAEFACAVAAVSVTRAGAQPSMPTLKEARGLLDTRIEYSAAG